MGRGKRGLSTIIVTLIIILISLVAIGIFWVVINNLIKGSSENIGLGKLTLSAEIKGVSVDNSSNNVTISIKRNVGEGDLVGMKFVFYNNSNTEVITENVELNQLQERRFVFHLSMNVSTLLTISIVPIFSSATGEENIGNVADRFNVRTGKRIETIINPPTGNQTCVPTTCAALGFNCGTYSNGCNGTLYCGSYGNGSCQSGYNCVAGTCVMQLGALCESNTYYVDFETGNDNNNGTCSTSAWKHSPGDDNATGIADTTVLTAGKIVRFKGGVEYLGRVDIDWSGNSANPITYDGNFAGNWGTGRAIIDGNSVNGQGFYDNGYVRNYITINNFEIQNIVNASPLWYTRGIYFRGASNGSVISNCYIHEVGTYTNADVNVGRSQIQGAGVVLSNPTNCKILNNTIRNMGGGISVSGGSNCTIKGNDVTRIYWGIEINGDSGLATGHNITGNTIYDLYMYDYIGSSTAPYWQGKLGGDDPHTDFIFIRKGSGTRPNGNIVENNLLYNNYDFGSTIGGTAMIFTSYADGTIIKNNVLINPHSYWAIEIGYGSDNTTIYGNTIYAPRTSCNGIYLYPSGASLGLGTKIKNNIIVGNTMFTWNATNEVGWEIDYNYYVSPLVNPQGPWHKTGGSYYEFGAWKTYSSQDSHSYVTNNSEDMKFISTAGYPTSCQTMNLGLQSTSLAIDKGVEISPIGSVFFNTDKNGVFRPQGAAWDMGAYERI